MRNDQEWRAHLFEEIKEIRKEVGEIKQEMVSLKIKVAGVSSILGAIVSYFTHKLM